MPGRLHAVRDLGQASAQAVEVDEGAEEGGDLDVRLVDEDGDEGFERGNVGVRLTVDVGKVGLDRRGRGRRGLVWRRTASDDVDGALSDISC